MTVLKSLYQQLPEEVFLSEKAAVTGYGEQLIKKCVKKSILVKLKRWPITKRPTIFQPGVDFIFGYRRTRYESDDH